MSNQFTYEIDERKLRMQLKDLEYPLSENSWQKFESFAATNVMHNASAGKGTFRLNLNRNIVLPVVFGAVVVSFSLLLLNFVSLKPNHKNEEQKAETLKPAVTIATPIKKEPIKMQQVAQIPQPVVSSEKTNPEAPVIAASNHSAGMMGEKLVSNSVSKPVETSQNTTAEITTPSAENIVQTQAVVNTEEKSDTEVVVKKKRRKHSDPAAQLQEEIRPTVVSDAQEEEVRPN